MPATSPEALERKRQRRKQKQQSKIVSKVRKMVPGDGANADPKIRLMRSAGTSANYRFGMGGIEKSRGHKPRKITLAPMPWDKPNA